MNKVDLRLSELSLGQKLDLMETLWADLTSDQKALESPVWHETVLKDREEAFGASEVTASDWDRARKGVRKKVS